MFVIAGLGNPGAGYERNRHNIGFMAADAIARRHGFSPWRRKFKAEIADGDLGGVKTLLIKPQTYMNLSGEAVGEALRFYKLAVDDLLVIHDELDLAAARVRIKKGGGAGGHNGLRSIDAHCGKEYRRLRLGIGHPGDKARVHGHVLGDFARADEAWLDPFLDAIAQNAPLLAKGQDSTFMNRVSLAVGGGKPDGDGKPVKTGKGTPVAKTRGQSHVRQARNGPKKDIPATGPMSAMLKKLFGDPK
ncbi:MAG: aminoacyl-tRNA hydrolase [Pseudomonadota bacterium]|nr:aminoacyl-tRNA hydrolase [Pseudomonadota bacterium]